MPFSSDIPRRRFLGSLAVVGATLSLPASLAAESVKRYRTLSGPGDWDHTWLDHLKAKHRPFFENKSMGGDTLAYPQRYYDAMVDGYGAKPEDITPIIGFAGTGWPIAITDEKWAAWSLSPNPNGGNIPGRNPVRGAADDDAAKSPPTVMSWKKRGAIFLVCNNALKKGAADIAAKTGGDAAKIHADMRTSIIPEFIVVPAMVAALALAQEHQCPYLVGS